MNERLEYPFIARTFQTNEGKEWYVEFPDVSGVVGGGKTQVDAVNDAFDNLRAHLTFLEEDGEALPIPSSFPDDSFSGKFALRMSKSLHKRVALNAKMEGISINSYLNEAIAEKVATDEADRRYNKAFYNVLNMIGPSFSQTTFSNNGSIMVNRYEHGNYYSGKQIGA